MTEVDKLISNLQKLMGHSLNAMDESALTEIKNKMGLLIEQEEFWSKQENTERFAYDLRNFLTWLCEYIESYDKEFWGDDALDDLRKIRGEEDEEST